MKFGEIAESIADRIDDPSQAGVEYYVGLEHLDSGSLKIRRWGTPDDVEATKLRFKPGDIIFGKRRAYQRKVAVAEFEGICSAHAMVLRAREENIVKEFLPFFMQGEEFSQRAVAISEGSLSPTIKWKTLAEQEFVLPSMDEQRRIAEILRSLDSAYLAWEAVLEAARDLRVAYLDRMFNAQNDRWPLGRLDEFATVQTGLAKGKRYGNVPTVSLPYLRVANVQDGYLDLTEIKEITVAEHEADRYRLKHGDVLLTPKFGSN